MQGCSCTIDDAPNFVVHKMLISQTQPFCTRMSNSAWQLIYEIFCEQLSPVVQARRGTSMSFFRFLVLVPSEQEFLCGSSSFIYRNRGSLELCLNYMESDSIPVSWVGWHLVPTTTRFPKSKAISTRNNSTLYSSKTSDQRQQQNGRG